MSQLDRSTNAQALHVQIVAYFREQIHSHALPPGSQLPTEMALSHLHHVSRNTVRQAMTTLVNEGLLERVQGRGTFVRQFKERRPAALPSVDKRIGLILSHTGDQLNMDILIGVEQAAKARGYEVSFAYSEDQPAEQVRDLARLQAGGAVGFIIFPLSDEVGTQPIVELHQRGIPLVLVDRYLPDLATDYVGVDNYTGGYRATEHLLILGHTRISFVYLPVGGLSTTSVRDRWRGYCEALKDYGVPYDERLVIQKSHYELFMWSDRPTAIFAVCDSAALDLLTATRTYGLRVPEDLALVGFDDLDYAAHLQPPLTTVAQSRMEVGLRAGNLLINRIEGQTGPAKHIELPTHLVVRESCGARLRIRKASSTSPS